MKSEKEKLEKVIIDQKKEMETLENSLQELNESNLILKEEKEVLERKIKKVNEELEQIKVNELAKVLEENINLKAKLSDAIIDCKEAKFELKILKKENTQLKKTITNLTTENDHVKRTMDEQINKRKSQIEEINNEKQILMENCKQLEEDNINLKEKCKMENLKSKTLLTHIKKTKYKK